MSDIQVCRVCLIMDVQMYNLRSSPVDSYFECIFGVNPHKHELLTQVCAECTVLIYKFYNFREKCIKGIGILQDIVRQNGKKTGKKKRPIPRPKIQMKVKKQKNDKASKDGNIFDIVTLTLDEQIEEVKAQEHTTAYQSAKNKCNICFKVFHRGENAYILHMKKHNPTYPNVCKVCGYRFLKLKSLRCHERLHKLKYLCKLCPTVFSVKQQAQMHQEWHEKKVFFKCKHCRKKFRQSSTYINHIRLKHPSPYVCHICGYSFLSALGLEQHRNFIHKDVKDKIMTGPWCDTCDMQFMHQQAFDKHLVQSSNHVNKIHCQPKKILASNSKES